MDTAYAQEPPCLSESAALLHENCWAPATRCCAGPQHTRAAAVSRRTLAKTPPLMGEQVAGPHAGGRQRRDCPRGPAKCSGCAAALANTLSCHSLTLKTLPRTQPPRPDHLRYSLARRQHLFTSSARARASTTPRCATGRLFGRGPCGTLGQVRLPVQPHRIRLSLAPCMWPLQVPPTASIKAQSHRVAAAVGAHSLVGAPQNPRQQHSTPHATAAQSQRASHGMRAHVQLLASPLPHHHLARFNIYSRDRTPRRW